MLGITSECHLGCCKLIHRATFDCALCVGFANKITLSRIIECVPSEPEIAVEQVFNLFIKTNRNSRRRIREAYQKRIKAEATPPLARSRSCHHS